MIKPNRINPIIKLTEKCNYNCSFCRYANYRRYDKGISEELVKKMVLQSQEYTIRQGNPSLNVIFHGGEPLLYDYDRFSSLLEFLDKNTEPGFLIEYSIQTNSSLITEEWIKLFKRYNFDVGISLDGPASLNSHWRIDNENSIHDAIQKYRWLRDEGIRCGFLSVITNEHLSRVNEFFDFFIDNNIDSLGLCYCYSHFDDNCVDPVKLGNWLSDLFDLYFHSESTIRIREFDNIIKRVLQNRDSSFHFTCRKNCGKYLTINPNGNLFYCDDFEFATNNDYSLGNLESQSINEIINGNKYQTVTAYSNLIINKKCKFCNVYPLCRGGCPRHDTEKENYFCETYKIIIPYIEKRVLSYLDNCACTNDQNN